MDRDSPVEWTGEAHLVTLTCQSCETADEMPEGRAEHLSEQDRPYICHECRQLVEQLTSDLHGSTVRRMEVLSDIMEAHGYYTKASMIRNFTSQYRNMKPVFLGADKWLQGDFAQTREGLEKAIRKYE